MSTIFQTKTRLLFDVFGPVYDRLTAHDLWRAQNTALADLAKDTLGAPPATLLDVGCGTGVGTWAMAKHLGPQTAVTGIDVTPSMIARATDPTRPRPDIAPPRFLTADAMDLPLSDGSFAAAVGASVLYLVPDADRVLAELFRVLAPGGVLVFLEPRAGASLRRAALSGVGQLSTAMRAPLDTAKLVASMVAWRAVSAAAKRPAPTALAKRAERAGFVEVQVTPTLGGLGVHLVARRP
jgi:demethylmenaquinone methyltransferase / 2-methoxy-6-polyprenyl-1,4-benzoquinol methylase